MNITVYPKDFLELGGDNHWESAPDCKHCWVGYPKVCTCSFRTKQGLIHGALEVDENGEPFILEKCDICKTQNKRKGSIYNSKPSVPINATPKVA